MIAPGVMGYVSIALKLLLLVQQWIPKDLKEGAFTVSIALKLLLLVQLSKGTVGSLGADEWFQSPSSSYY